MNFTSHPSISRRSLLLLGGTACAAAAGYGHAAATTTRFKANRIRSVTFDAFAIFNLEPLWAACESAFPGNGSTLGAAWRSRQFEYQWLTALAGKYQDFWETTRNALIFAARSTQLRLSAATQDSLLQTYLRMPVWPDVATVIAQLKASGRQVLILSNATQAILQASLQANELLEAFDYVLSTDQISSFKPDPKAYQLALDHTGYRRDENLFVASAGWDAAGARWFGFPTFWNNRLLAPREELEVSANASGPSLCDMARMLQLA